MKEVLLKGIRSLPIRPTRQEEVLFFLKLGYWPNFYSPRTFNEKINQRKLFSKNTRIVTCSDKIAVREYVAQRLGEDILVPLLYTGDEIAPEVLNALGDDIVAKPSHDSKSTELIYTNTPEIATAAASRLNAKRKVDYGKATNQFPYSEIQPRILVEKMLIQDGRPVPDDIKIFCFKQRDGSSEMLIELHTDRELPSYTVSWYDCDMKPIPMNGRIYQIRDFPYLDVLPKMRNVAQVLSEEFDHVRIDLYFVSGKIYFGEMTFFDGGGRTEYSTCRGKRHDLDRKMGRLWECSM